MPELSTIQIFYTVLLATTFLTQGLIAAWVYRYQWDQSGAKWFLIMVGTGMVWVLPYIFFFVVTNPTYQYVAHGIGFFGALSTVCAFVVFASKYTEAGFHHNRLIQAHLVAIIGGYLILAPTNNMHHLIFADFRAVSEPFSYIAVQRGVVFWGMLLSLQIPGLYAYYRLVTNLRSSQRHGREQLILFIVGALSINTLDYVDHLTTLLPMDGFPDSLLGMFVFYVFVTVALFRFNLLEVKPVARKTVIENLHDPVLVIEEQNRLVDFNEAATAVWPALPARLLDPFETACPEVEAAIETPLEGTFTTELTIERDGVEHHYSVTASAVTADGTETGWYSIVLREITDRREREQELRKREQELKRAREQLRQIIDLVPDPLYVKNLDDEVLLSNEANAELHGMTPEEIEGKREFDIEPDVENIENFDQYRQREIEVMETGEPTTFEEELLDPDDNTRTFKMTRIPFKTTGTDEDAVLGYARDVTDLKEYEQELKELNTRLELALEETNTGVWEWDLDTEEVRWDATSDRLFGYDVDEFSGFSDRVPEDDLQRVREQVDHAIETGEQYRAEFRVEPPTEDQRWVQARGVVEYDADGEPERLLGVQTDITERKERERQLHRQNERLDQFTGAVSHDLRNPLMVALARLDMIRDAAPEEHVETMERNLERMEEMIDDLLTLARIDQHTKEFERVRLAGTARDAWEHADVADCEFESSIPESATVEADRSRLLQIFENLFRNAADHNDVPLTVRVGMLSDNDSDIDGGQRTGFFIEDNGTGIPDEQRDKIFDRGHTTSAEGTGFGLSIVRDIVTEHGWDIRVTDGADGGARFEITGVDIGG